MRFDPKYISHFFVSPQTLGGSKLQGAALANNVFAYNSINLTMGVGFAGCCGARQISNLIGKFTSEKEKQEFLYTFLLYSPQMYTNYFIASTTQKTSYLADKDSLLSLLVEMGAKEVDDTANQVHGPNKMHLFVWAPNLHKDKLKKYLSETVGEYYNSLPFAPKWWTDKSEKEQQEWIASQECENILSKHDEFGKRKIADSKAQYRSMQRGYIAEAAMSNDPAIIATLKAFGLAKVQTFETVISKQELQRLRQLEFEAAQMKKDIQEAREYLKQERERNNVITRDAKGRFTKAKPLVSFNTKKVAI